MEPQALVAVLIIGFVGLMLLISKIFTKLWIYALLLSPSWSVSIFNIAKAVSDGEPLLSALSSHALGLIFVLSPIDQYLIPDPSFFFFGAVLLGIWAYVILVSSHSILGGLGLPLAPWIFWLLGKGLPNTMKVLGNYLPSWLTECSGLPLIFIASLILACLVYLSKRRRRR